MRASIDGKFSSRLRFKPGIDAIVLMFMLLWATLLAIHIEIVWLVARCLRTCRWCGNKELFRSSCMDILPGRALYSRRSRDFLFLSTTSRMTESLRARPYVEVATGVVAGPRRHQQVATSREGNKNELILTSLSIKYTRELRYSTYPSFTIS